MRIISAGVWTIFLTAVLFIFGCSSTSTVSEKEKEVTSPSVNSVYPNWYNSSQRVSSSASSYQGFGSAVAADSLGALSQATERANNNLESGISAKLESIRSEALVKLGSDSGLGSPRFIVVLRKAENEVSDISEAKSVVVEQNDPNGFKAFVKVVADKSELIDELDRRFSGYAKAWNAMKNSEAFSDF